MPRTTRRRAQPWMLGIGICAFTLIGTYFLATAPLRPTAPMESNYPSVDSGPSATQQAGFALPTLPAPALSTDGTPPAAAEPEVAATLPAAELAPPPSPSPSRDLLVAPEDPPFSAGEDSLSAECETIVPTFSDESNLTPKLAQALKRARTALEVDDPLGAIDALDGLLGGGQLGAAGEYLAGTALLRFGSPTEARDRLERAAWQAPDQAAVWIELAAAHLAKDAPAMGYRAARRALRLAPENHRTHFVLGRALMELHRYDEALAAFEAALDRCPAQADAWNSIGLIWLYRGENEKARAVLERATRCPGCPAYAHNNLGIVYERLGLYEWADREYARCLAVDPQHASAAASRRRVAPFLAVRPWAGQSRSR